MSDVYLELAELPTYLSARFDTPKELSITASIADHDKNVKKIFSKTVSIPPTSAAARFEESDSIKAIAVSSTRDRRALLKQLDVDADEKDSDTDKKSKDGKVQKRVVEIWKGKELEASLDVTDEHGEFYADDFYRSIAFSPKEDAFVYTAEANEPKVDSSASDPYATFRYIPPLGEGFGGKKRPTLFVFKWTDSNPRLEPILLEQEPATPVLYGQADWVNERTLVATGYEYTPEGRLLGIKYCQNRPAGIYTLEYQGEKWLSKRITDPKRSYRSSRVSPDRKYVYFLSNPVLGPHASCVSLHEYSVEKQTERVVVDTVFSPGDTEFPGLYMDQLPPQPFVSISNGAYLVTHSSWRAKTALLLINPRDGKVTDLTPELANFVALTTDGVQRVVCVKSSIIKPGEIVLGTIDEGFKVTWETIDSPELTQSTKEKLASLEVSVIPIPGRGAVETTVIKHKSNSGSAKALPCINAIHGGPHSSFTQTFMPSIVAQALDGYIISLPSYIGTTGYGENNLQALIGNCGSTDIVDCLESAKHLIKLGICEEGPGKQFLSGGSHGGFITGHLIGQYPDFFTAAVARNPVIAGGETANTDIVDWYYSEFGFAFKPTSLVTAPMYEQMQASSPIHHVDKVKTPLLLLIGLSDNRVAPSQGIGYYHALKGRNKTVDILTFPKDSHPLEGVEAAKISYSAGRDWFARFSRS